MMIRNERPAVLRAVERLERKDSMYIHGSASKELINYSRHLGVEDLDDDEIEKVIERVAELAGDVASRAGRDRVGGGDVRGVIIYLCGETFSDCSNVAQQIIEGDNVSLNDDDLRRINSIVNGEMGGGSS